MFFLLFNFYFIVSYFILFLFVPSLSTHELAKSALYVPQDPPVVPAGGDCFKGTVGEGICIIVLYILY